MVVKWGFFFYIFLLFLPPYSSSYGLILAAAPRVLSGLGTLLPKKSPS